MVTVRCDERTGGDGEMARGDQMVEVRFPKLNHFWLDSGLSGLYRIASEYSEKNNAVSVRIDRGGVTFAGMERCIQGFLEECYAVLLDRYYNTSSEKQVQENDGFYYDSVEDRFVRFPKVKQMGIAALIFSKAVRPKNKKGIKFLKGAKGQLPDSHAELQARLDSFLKETGLKVSTSELLVDAPNAIQPRTTIAVKRGLPRGRCFLCGCESHSLDEIGSTAFPFISGSSGGLSFATMAGSPERVCWQCDFIGKFIPVSGFYTSDKNSLHIFLPYSKDLEKMNEVFEPLHAIEHYDPYRFRNFHQPLDSYFRRPFETAFSFFYALYLLFLRTEKTSSADSILDYDKLFNVTLSKSPLEFIVINTETLGKTQMGKMVWPFQDAVYFFRLIESLEGQGVSIKAAFWNMVDFSVKKDENKTLTRNRFCERVLKKLPVVDIVEQHVFRICMKGDVHIGPLVDFTLRYEAILKEGGKGMEQGGVDAAVKLGKRIGGFIAGARNGRKGDLFALRKARKLEDFLNEINRIQFRYDLAIPSELYEGYLNKETFGEFKQFCLIAALNSYNGVKYHHASKGGTA